ncbi:hypothetical protein [Clostridium sp. Cult2]
MFSVEGGEPTDLAILTNKLFGILFISIALLWPPFAFLN